MTTPTALKAQKKASSKDPFLINFLFPARKIDTEAGEFNSKDYPFNIWDAMIFPFFEDRTETMYYYLAVIKFSEENKRNLLSSIYAPPLGHTDPRFDELIILHRDNNDYIRQELGKSYEEIMDLLNVPGRGQFIETRWLLTPYAFQQEAVLTKTAHKKVVEGTHSRGFWMKSAEASPGNYNNGGPPARLKLWRKWEPSFRIYPDHTVGMSMDSNTNAMVLFIQPNGDAEPVYEFTQQKDSWQVKKISELEERNKVFEKTTAVPSNTKSTKQKHFSSMALYDLACRYQDQAGWNTMDTTDIGQEFERDLKSYKEMLGGF